MNKIRLMIVGFVAIFMVAFTATAASATTQNFPDTYGQNGTQLATTSFNSFLNNSGLRGITVCVTAKAAGGSENVKVFGNNGTFSATVGPFGTGSFTQKCDSAIYNWPNQTDFVNVKPISAGGGGIYLRQVTIN